MFPTPSECARAVLEVAPLIMRTLVGEIRRRPDMDLSVPQLRSLAFLRDHEGACLSDVAEHLGLTLPSMSKMIDGLVARAFVLRHTNPSDRRRVTLALTEGGRGALQVAHEAALSFLAVRLAVLGKSELTAIVEALGILKPLFDGGREIDGEGST